ncbi:cell division septum initiation protein DivIVA [Aequitasia blattaphilus]|uniref:DivIVA domain-containing protein n=1 Tax=Aequitasia blattaphilus TaxID=2949332 RepID=A0ABT1E9B3_9FIRM|nr:DivIVA domain-containing protein [Aequitasia blattaphilus]MCP1102415.1 DivIVA domain-containing protein [Aequitasia blattaphilus]MCR8615055.1 DivIVA domain-containing protein [Aequitasia blattaphilus]
MEFEEERRGYNKEQVDEYITTLRDEYQNLLKELQAGTEAIEDLKRSKRRMSDKLESLQKEKKELSQQVEQMRLTENTSYSEAIASALVTAEISAQQIIAKAKKEARLIGDAATRDLSDIIQAKQEALDEIKQVSGKLFKLLREEEALKAERVSMPNPFREGKKEE